MNRALVCTCVAGLAALTLASPAAAQISIGNSPASAPALGRVARGTTATVFVINPSTGAVTRVSGNAARVTTGTVTSPTITVTCGIGGNCKSRNIRVRVTAGASSDATIVSFAVSNLTGSTYVTGSPPNEAASLDFQITTPGGNASATFKLGLRVQVAASAAGLYNLPWTVVVDIL